jgi:amino acid adenylation domain-containing protein
VLGEGEVGEIWIRGPSVAEGYWQAPEATRQVFGAYTSDGRGPFLRTGDLAFCRAGELFIAGRSKDLILVRGRNVYPQDLELAAETSHALLRSGGACAFGLDSAGGEQVVLVLEVPDGAEGLPAVAKAARQAIAGQHEVSLQAVVLVRTGALPRTTSGKLQRGSCREQLLANALPVIWDSRVAEPESAAGAAECAAEPPRGELEQLLAQLWCEVLGFGYIGRSELFLERGGDSLRALQLSARIEERLGAPLPAALLFEACSVASLGEWLQARHGGLAAGGSTRVASPSVAVDPPGPFALSATQERIWFLEQLAEGAAIHHLGLALELRGELRREPLQRAVARLVERHAALRTRFVLVDGRPLQRVAAAGQGLCAPASELVARSEQELQAILRDAVCRPFQLEQAPPVRWTLVQRGPHEHVLVLACHHLVADGWSLNLLLRELCVSYAAELEGSTPLLPAVPASYADYVAWQVQPERAARQEQARAYWLERLRTLESSELPTDRPRPAIQSYAGARLELLLEPALLQRLEAAGRRSGGTLFSTLATALFALLYRATGQADLCLGTPLFDRGRRAFEQLVGCCVNTLALRVEVLGELTLAELASRVQTAVREGLEHGELPFERVLAALPSRRDPSRSPLFQWMLTVQPELGGLPPVPGLTLGVRQLGTDAAQFDLAIDVARDGASARVAWEYNRELFDADTMHAYWARFCRLLEAFCADPGQRVSAVELRGAAEREQARALAGRRQGAAGGSAPLGVLQRVAHWVATQPAAPALVQGDERWSYAELGRRAQQLAQQLRRAGVAREARVALYLPSSPRLVAAALGVLQAGGAYVPLELQQPRSRLEQVLAEAEVRWIVSERALADGLPPGSAQLILLDELAPEEAVAQPLPVPEPEQLAYVLFTSGSTGKPKGVLVSHGMLRDTCRGWDELYRWGARPPRVLGVSNPAFDVWSADWLRALCSGGCLVFAGAEVLLDPPALSALIAAQQIDLVDLVPSVLRPLLAHWQAAGSTVPQHVRVFIVGSEAWSCGEYRALRRELPASTRLLSCYGVTEATIDSAWFEAGEAGAPAGEGSVPLGVPLPGSQLYVLDRDGVELPAGMAGELAIGGAGVARGYAGRARWTAERFRPDPFSVEPGARLYLSGDRVRRTRDGNLEFLGRRDQQLKLRGRRVEPAEIERQLLAHPAIAACAVSLWQQGGGEPLLLAYLVPSAQPIPGAELRAQLRALLPEALLPSRVVWLGALPLNANGKLDRARLPEPVAEVASSPAAAGELEQRIAAIWQEALGLPRVGRHDNFFDLGGHSLLLTRVLGKLRAEVRADLAMVTLFRHPTVAALAEALGAGEPAAAPVASAAAEARAADRRRELRARRRSLEQDE